MFRHQENVRERRRLPTHTLERTRCSSSAHRRVPRRERRSRGIRRHRRSDVLPVGVRFHPWVLGFKQSSFSLIAQVSRSSAVHVFRAFSALPTCCCPLDLSAPGKLAHLKVIPPYFAQLRWVFSRCVTRRTLSTHHALQAGTRRTVSPAPFLAAGEAGVPGGAAGLATFGRYAMTRRSIRRRLGNVEGGGAWTNSGRGSQLLV